jgi:hypothetical protein
MQNEAVAELIKAMGDNEQKKLTRATQRKSDFSYI